MGYPLRKAHGMSEIDLTIIVDGTLMTFGQFLAAHRYIDDDWQVDILLDLEANGCSTPRENHTMWAAYSSIVQI
jgi:hypothetical protein